MRAISIKRRGEAYKRAKAEKALGREPGGMGVCARCGDYRYVNGHERISRSQGGDPTKPDCLLCTWCNTWCEDRPVWAAFHGWKLSDKHERDMEMGENEARRRDGSIHTFGVLVETQ